MASYRQKNRHNNTWTLQFYKRKEVKTVYVKLGVCWPVGKGLQTLPHLKRIIFHSLMIQYSKRKTNLIVVEYVKGAIVCLKVLENANSLLAKPALWLLRITLESKRISIFSKAICSMKSFERGHNLLTHLHEQHALVSTDQSFQPCVQILLRKRVHIFVRFSFTKML